MQYQTVRVTLMTSLMIAATTLVPGTSSILLADCPTPSFVIVAERNCPSCTVEQTVDSRIPGLTIHLDWTAILQERQVFHGGDVTPGTQAVFNYVNVATGVGSQYVTAAARPNGVIHHETEERFFVGQAGDSWEVEATWIDECGAGLQEHSIGFVTMQ
jgi:hypothetical protein